MRNLLLGFLLGYLLVTPTVKAGFNSDIKSIVDNLNKITRIMANIELLVTKKCQ